MTSKKTLMDLDRQELFQRFPIILLRYDPLWPDVFLKEKNRLKYTLDESILAIHHIGSSAVPYILSKPTLDILVEVHPKADIERIAKRLKALGYITEQTPKKPVRMVFMKGYTLKGYAPYPMHLHLREKGDQQEVTFKNILLQNAKARYYYQRLKLNLSHRHKYDRDAYTEAKTSLIKHLEKTRAH